jgi:hypothetical protein
MLMPHTMVNRPRALVAAASLALVLSLFAPGAARAQFLPAVFYGTGLQPGQSVDAYVYDKFCVSTTANDRGEWVLQIPAEAPCGPTDGAPVTFTVDSQVMTSAPAATWQSGGIPAGSIATGYTLTPGSGVTLPPAPSVTATPPLGSSGTTTGTPGADGTGTATSTGTAEGNGDSSEDGDDDGGNSMLFAGLGVVAVAAAAAGGFFLYRRNAA